MPRKEGFDCPQEIHKNSKGIKQVLVIMPLTSSDPEKYGKGVGLGANIYAVRPGWF